MTTSNPWSAASIFRERSALTPEQSQRAEMRAARLNRKPLTPQPDTSKLATMTDIEKRAARQNRPQTSEEQQRTAPAVVEPANEIERRAAVANGKRVAPRSESGLSRSSSSGLKHFDRSGGGTMQRVERILAREGQRGSDGRVITRDQIHSTWDKFANPGKHGWKRQIPIRLGSDTVGNITKLETQFGADGRMELLAIAEVTPAVVPQFKRSGFCLSATDGRIDCLTLSK